MSIFESKIILARKLITKFGTKVTVTSQPAPVPDPTKPWSTVPSASVTTPTVAAFLNFSSDYKKDTTIQTGDQKVYLPPDGLDNIDLLSATITVGGVVWRIIKIIQTLAPAGEVVSYIVQVRR